MKTRIYPKDFQMHQQSLYNHSYCKRESTLTKLKNSRRVMIFVARLASSPIYLVPQLELGISCYNTTVIGRSW
jgi:hypothetical protein